MSMPIKVITILPIMTIIGNIINTPSELYPVTGLILTGYIIINQKR